MNPLSRAARRGGGARHPARAHTGGVPSHLSIVIPAHDEALLLGGTLAALDTARARLSIGSDVIVVSDGSGDATSAIASAAGATVIDVDLRHIAATRNAGAEQARGDALLFLDADTHVSAVVLQAAIDALAAGAVGGGAMVLLQADDSLAHERATARMLSEVFRWTGIAPGCFLFCTRAAFDAVAGFDTSVYAGEDVAMSRALAKLGRFEILRESVRTSSRKLRSHSVAEHLALAVRYAWRGKRMLTSRDELGFWYERRQASALPRGPDTSPGFRGDVGADEPQDRP